MPDGQAYLDIQTSWMSNAQDPSDSLTLTVIVSSQGDVLDFAKNNILIRPDVADSSEHSVDDISVTGALARRDRPHRPRRAP